MEYRILGKTGLKITRLGFGGIPIQRIDADIHAPHARFFQTFRKIAAGRCRMGVGGGVELVAARNAGGFGDHLLHFFCNRNPVEYFKGNNGSAGNQRRGYGYSNLSGRFQKGNRRKNGC